MKPTRNLALIKVHYMSYTVRAAGELARKINARITRQLGYKPKAGPASTSSLINKTFVRLTNARCSEDWRRKHRESGTLIGIAPQKPEWQEVKLDGYL